MSGQFGGQGPSGNPVLYTVTPTVPGVSNGTRGVGVDPGTHIVYVTRDDDTVSVVESR